MKITTLEQFEDFLLTRIPTREALFMGDIGLKRAKYFMKLLGNPQNKIKVIHIAGTSGKGSTAHLTSHILQSQEFSVGMSISPHIFDIRERMQINNQLPNEKLILKYFNQILPTILKMEKSSYGMPTFFEINVALAFYMFAKEKLDYAVMETGLGGRLDATNTVTNKNKICIITKLGLDHTQILGKTISEIALEKAGIINSQNTTINTQQTPAAQTVIKNKCEEKNSVLHIINNKNYSIISSTTQETIFDFHLVIPVKTGIQPLLKSSVSNITKDIKSGWIPGQARNDKEKKLSLKNIHLGLIGIHQAENCSLALACLSILSKRDNIEINETKLRGALEKITIPGRLEIRKIGAPPASLREQAHLRSVAGGQTLIIDGAHNPQKMKTLSNNLAKIYPSQKFTFVIAFKKGKDFKVMLKYIIPLADKILLTQFSTSGMDNHWSSIDNQEIATFLQSQNFKNFSIIKNKRSDILKNIRTSKEPVVITGSLYLISSIYPFLKI
ncbi:MAG: bifunctional folylpolyglutamate synthase/ dihydrofolate synthase [Candidatus Moranbacteria bacterium GW2011_GWC2_37_73]|nr:MAG: bifunctional folylpolyglutamate synthase/ dihydrofolate synthase [Parcubacteria group bacterium GW2011_GWC1_36_108]KKQ39968.1 MAG: bifunctional folylpolyglutamate synthase/ dihydrofolate synthase [Candidatus Moranbacteria bacterium GW2011_GWC2_37_73]HAS00082.1 hypothetical protein [Candidatus Moranbacteria bacterium]HBI50376.1 hypothetical protein [Candidatus Moranbacteria bacterium]HBU10353.1 hypothetical protein [Candidatus Moranbacteria bacterium]